MKVWDRALLVSGVILAAAIAGNCSSGPPKPDVVVELQKLKIPNMPKTFTDAQKADIEKHWDGPGKWFVRRGCFTCHTISVYGVKGLTTLGPDLSIAVEDVQTRFGRTLEDFLQTPQGTMQMVMSDVIKLTPEEKAEALAELKTAFAEYQKRKGAPGTK